MPETRKIVKSGNTSFILSLPINWVRKNNLKTGKLVTVLENEQGDLILSAVRRTISRPKYVTIKVDNKDNATMDLEFLTAYIRDAASIVFEGKEIVPKTSQILEKVRSFIGLDVIEQSTNSIVVKNFFTLDNETSPFILVKKMDIINRACFEQLQLFFKGNFSQEDFFELQKLNEQNRRLFILTKKSILKLLEHPQLMKSIHTNHLRIFKEQTYSQAFMNISLILRDLGQLFLFLDCKRKDMKLFQKKVAKLLKNYQNLMNAIHNKSLPEIHEFLRKYSEKREELEKFTKTLDDPLTIQAANLLPQFNYNLRIIAYESLI